MITKEQCLVGTKVKVNHTKTRWNTEMGTKNNGLVCFPFKKLGVHIDEEMELSPDSVLVIQSKPKKFNGNGNQVKFTIEGSDTIMSAWWICFKHKVDIVDYISVE